MTVAAVDPVGAAQDPEAALLDKSTPFIDQTVATPTGTRGQGLTSNTRVQGDFPGLVEPGNIDLTSRPQVKNADGSVSTVRSASFNIDGKEVLLPTVSPDGKDLTDDQAVDLFKKTGQHLGKFENPDQADAYAEALHKQQSTAYGLDGPPAALAPVDKLRQDVADVGTAQTRGEIAQGEQSAVDQQTAEETRQQRARDLVDRQAQEQFNQDAIDANRKKQEIAQKSAETPYHEFKISTGRSILASLGMILGGVSYDPHHQNQAVEIYQNAIKQDLEVQRAQHENLWKGVEQAIAQGQQLSGDQLNQMKEFEQEKAEKLQAIIDKGESLKAFSKNEQGKAALDAEHAKLRAQLDDTIVNATRLERAEKETERHNLATEGNAAARLAKRKGSGTGGAGRADALQQFIDAAGQLKPGDRIPGSIGVLGLKAGIKPAALAATVDKYRNSGAAATSAENKAEGKGKAGGAPAAKDIVFYQGKPVGPAPGGRGGAAAIEKGLVAYDDGLESLEALKKYRLENPVVGSLAKGDAYNRAVLAIAATSTANASDTTTKHEADTLKGLVRIDPDAIQRSIDHITSRRDAQLESLRARAAYTGAQSGTPATGGAETIKRVLPNGQVAEYNAAGKRIK